MTDRATVDTTAPTAGWQVFISYAGPDRTWAEWTARTLAEDGFQVALDLWDWRVGERLDERLGDAARSGVLVLPLSPDCLASPWAEAEWSTVLAKPDVRGRLLPVEIEPLPADGLPSGLSAVPSVRIFGLPEEEAVSRLVSAGCVTAIRSPPGCSRDRGGSGDGRGG
ncbi:toll/interleukin-1 receptor domain-containing protein [Streptomyces sp. NPDC059454]|uniref:toll/interleukin-1 receptor domain-containing protein n=1 Tax=Streptomyces sp. NPDC059454 TaxID=3346836 RepID=UPI0036B902AF